MHNQWRSAQWTSGERAEPKPSLLGVVKPYVLALLLTPVFVLGILLLGILLSPFVELLLPLL